ncbi:MAG: hypothetical protein K2J82_09740 [Muribaculaceae bacterium]|nr:hypothetical protein [Muribaculaceae bacterium]MDE6754876.1 hypothetical protein [Muribaculaceae bacterium]
MSKSKLKKYLQTLQSEQIIQVVMDLYDARKEAKEYLEFFLNPDSKEALEKAKKELFRNYFTPQGRTRAKVSTKTGNDIVNNFIRLDTDPETVADLLVYHIEVMMSRLLMRHIVGETAWNALINTFRKAVDYIQAYNMKALTERRIERIMEFACQTPTYLHIEDRLKQELEEVSFYE